MQRDPLKARDSPLPSAVKGALASAMPFRSSLKKHSFGRFFYERVFLALFFSLAFFGFIFVVAPTALHRSSLGRGLAMRPPLCCRAATWVCGPVLPNRSHSPFTTQLFTDFNHKPAFFQKTDRSGHAMGCSTTTAPVAPPAPSGSVTTACKVGHVLFHGLQ